MPAKKKPSLAPDAARILAQYRNAGKISGSADGTPTSDSSSAGPAPARTSTPPAGGSTVRRSGTRGK